MTGEDLSTTPVGVDRRGFIKRAAVAGAVTAWATPTIQSLTTPAFAVGSPAGGCTACLTGGGQILSAPGSPVVFNTKPIPKLSFGLGQLCCEGQGPIQIEVNAHPNAEKSGDVSYHFTVNLAMTCSKAGDPAPPPQTAECANTFTGTVQDSAGNTLTFMFQDNGEPGRADAASIRITAPGGAVILTGAGTLDKGNLQAHPSLGPIKRDCSGC